MPSNLSLVERIRLSLDADLREGRMPPGAPVSVKDLCDRLKVSGTPVREALERLVGEGRIVATGSRQGFAIPRFGVRALAGLYSFAAVLVEVTLHQLGAEVEELALVRSDAEASPAIMTDRVIRALTDAGTNPIVIFEAARIGAILAPYRAAEPAVLTDWRGELTRLEQELRNPAAAVDAIRAYTRTRLDLIAMLMDAADQLGTV